MTNDTNDEAMEPIPPAERIGFALVGLGSLTLNEILPAFGDCKYSKVTALVSNSHEKAKDVAEKYGIAGDAIFSYDDFEKLKDRDDVQAVFIVLPNAMHREYTERAAAIGKHVLCEKPMATNVEDAQAMLDACERAGVKLMIAYRCQYEPFNLELVKRCHDGGLGKLRFIEAINTQRETEADQWRLKADMAGGGALPDIGLYCLNAARYVSREEPVSVFAWMSSPPSDPRFAEVEERMGFMLRFPSDVIAMCSTSYDAYETKQLAVRLEKGWMRLNDAFAYKGKQLLVANEQDGNAVITDLKLVEQNQFALEIDHMARCIMRNEMPRTSGAEGLKDQIIIDALYRSAKEGVEITL